jgi:hypothetical protein
MDKVKIFLAIVKKQQFWVLCGVMLLTTLACWYLATCGLAKDYETRKASINQDFTGTKLPPNPTNQDQIDKISKEQHKALRENVLAAWQTLYDEQQEKNPFPTEVLGEGFEKQFRDLKLPQSKLDSVYRQSYQTFLIKDYIPKLLKMIDVRRSIEDKDFKNLVGAGGGMADDGAGAGMRPGAGFRGMMNKGADPAKEKIGIVSWDPLSFDKLLSHFAWGEVPSTMDVVVAQEDLWVYQALLRVIAQANKKLGATNPANAAVKRINALEIGRDSREAWRTAMDTVFRMGRTGGASGPGAPPTMGVPPPPTPDASGQPGSADRQYERELFVDRYVDDKGQPLAVNDNYPYVTHTPPEYKMMPIHINLLIDQRYLPDVLVECANSNMPIEVKRVRLLKFLYEPLDIEATPTKATPRNPRGIAGGGGKGFVRGGRIKPTAGAGGGNPNPLLGGTGADAPDDFDVPVEIFAIIYIYNPPDREKLGIGPAAGNPAAAGGPANPAASTPAAPATPAK